MPRLPTHSPDIPEQLKKTFLATANPLRFLKGDTICHEGDFDRHLYLITEGEVEISKSSQANTSTRVGLLSAGEVFGEISFVFGYRRIATITAIENTTVYRLSPAQAHQLIHVSDDLYLFLQELGIKRWVSSLLQTLPVFQNVDAVHLSKLLEASRHRTLTAGSRLFSPGDRLEEFNILLSGMMELTTDNDSIDLETIHCINPTESLENQPSRWRASSVTESIIAQIPLSIIVEEKESNPVFAEQLQEALISTA